MRAWLPLTMLYKNCCRREQSTVHQTCCLCAASYEQANQPTRYFLSNFSRCHSRLQPTHATTQTHFYWSHLQTTDAVLELPSEFNGDHDSFLGWKFIWNFQVEDQKRNSAQWLFLYEDDHIQCDWPLLCSAKTRTSELVLFDNLGKASASEI